MKKLNKNQFDVVIVGSGPAGVHAAYPLVEAGLRVAIIDGGLDSKRKDGRLREFPEAHITKNGHYYDFIRKSSYVFNKTYSLLKINSNIEVFQSLAKGGMSEVWHGICDFYSKSELRSIGLPVDIIYQEYKEVANRINLSRKPSLDFHSSLILEVAKEKKIPEATVYQVPQVFPYRTRKVIEHFASYKNFTYIPNQLVVEAHEKGSLVEIQSFSIDKTRMRKTYARYLILAAGSFNTTRILLRSLGLYNYKTSFLTKANYLVACFHPRTLLKKDHTKKSNAGQVVVYLDGIFTQLYKLNPLVLDKVLKYVPLPKFISLPLLSIFAPSLVVADIRFPAFESKNKYCYLKKTKKGDTLEVFYKESVNELKSHSRDCVKIAKQLRFVGLYPLKTVKGHIASHYAGGVPITKKTGKLSVDSLGKLHQAKRVYVADASTWRLLPAKSPTLTIMANASRVGKNVLNELNRNFS